MRSVKKKSVGDAPKFNWAKSIFSFGWGNGRAQKEKIERQSEITTSATSSLFYFSIDIFSFFFFPRGFDRITSPDYVFLLLRIGNFWCGNR